MAEWLDLLAPVVLDAHAERAWRETLVLDNTWFMVENRRTHRQTLAFHVLGAYGYPAGARRGRVWALHTSHQATQADWEAFMRSLDVSAPPKLVITDGSAAIGNAVRAVWPVQPGPSLPGLFLARCEHHLHVNGVEAMEGDGIGGWAPGAGTGPGARQPLTGAAPPFRAPAACWWARTLVESRCTTGCTGAPSLWTCTCARIASQVLSADQRRSRSWQVFGGPYRCGMSRQGAPVASFGTIPFSTWWCPASAPGAGPAPAAAERCVPMYFDQLEQSLVEDEALAEQAKANTLENFTYGFDKTFEGAIIDRQSANDDLFRKLMDDGDFSDLVKAYLRRRVYGRLTGEGPAA